jgi:hypothetical protein
MPLPFKVKPKTLVIAALAVGLLTLGACTTTPDQRGPFHEYLHQQGLE